MSFVEIAPVAVTPERNRPNPYEPYRPLLSADRVRELSTLRPLRVVFDTTCCWACILAAWTAVNRYPTMWTVLLAIPLIGSRFYALFIIGHDGLHRRLFASRHRNDLFNDLFIMGPMGAITRLNNKNHLGHHRYLATTNDPDRHKHGCFNKARLSQLIAYLTGTSSLKRSLVNVFKPGRSSSGPVAQSKQGVEHYALRDIVIVVGWQVMLVGGLSWSIGFWAYPLLWLLPFYMFTFLADNLRSFLEHAQVESDQDADRHRLITYTSNRLERWFLSPMNMNFHAAHHLWPSIPYYHLPVADQALRESCVDCGLEWRNSYLAFLIRYIRRELPLRECVEDRGEPLPL